MRVSVPIRGLFNLTDCVRCIDSIARFICVSVPIRGLFNLTGRNYVVPVGNVTGAFPSPSGDYLI